MKPKLILLLLFIIVLISCDETVKRPFDFQRYDSEGISYLEKYSESIWSDSLDSLINSPGSKSRMEDVRNKYGSDILSDHYNYLVYSKPYNSQIWLMKYGDAYVLQGADELPCTTEDINKITECILEMSKYQVESGEWVEVYYLRKGKKSIAFDATCYPADFVWME